MKMKKRAVCLVVLALLTACKDSELEQTEMTQAPSGFSAQQAKNNLVFTKNQYIKMLEHVSEGSHLHFAKVCETDKAALCYPRAKEHNAIFMERPEKWTNGFYPGLFWKLLASDEAFDILSDAEEQKIKTAILPFQYALASEALRDSTHDLGFILYDSFGEALEYQGISESDRVQFNNVLRQGRNTLVKRYSPEYNVIKSWDFIATFRLLHQVNGKVVDEKLPISTPWSYPVIVDNMMNLEFLLSDTDLNYHDVAYNHAATTMKHHYFFESDDTGEERPISYHLIDYGSMRPGNWQGMGAVSAWARGQAWSYYGFVTVLEHLSKQQNKAKQRRDVEHHLDRLFNTISYFLKDDAVPNWDYFAERDNAPDIASNMDPSTTAYSRVLDLCPSRLDKSVLPYKNYRPISIDKTMLSPDALVTIAAAQPINGGSFIEGDKISPCGSEEYDLSGRKIPKDTSAAAIYAAAMYRYAQFTNDKDRKQSLIAMADKIMFELSRKYRSDVDSEDKKESFKLGFVLTQATGNMPEASEIDTSIVYADFYFTEANIRKLQLQQND